MNFLVIGEIATEYILKVIHFPKENFSCQITNLFTTIGGGGKNCAVFLSALGATVSLVSKVGNTDETQNVYTLLKRHGLDTSFVKLVSDSCSTVIFDIVDNKGDRKVYVLSPPSVQLTASDITSKMMMNADCVVITATTWEAMYKSALLGKRLGKIVAFNPSAEFMALTPVQLDRILKNIDIVFLNRREAFYFARKSSLKELSEALRAQGPQVAAITLGKDGCFISSENLLKRVPSFKVKNVSSMGLGDAFAAGFLYSLVELRERNLLKCAVFGNAAAACVCSSGRMSESPPTLKQVRQMIEK